MEHIWTEIVWPPQCWPEVGATGYIYLFIYLFNIDSDDIQYVIAQMSDNVILAYMYAKHDPDRIMIKS